MLHTIFATIQDAIGIDTFSHTVLVHMLIRSTIIYLCGVTIARFNKKLLGIRTPFNFILFVMLGSTFANAIIDEKLFLAIIATVAFLMILSGFLTITSFYFPAIERFIKGAPSILVKNGKIQWHAMQRNFITEHELLNELRTQLHTDDLSGIESAILASDGSINFITK